MRRCFYLALADELADSIAEQPVLTWEDPAEAGVECHLSKASSGPGPTFH
jgi:hypothetical protein